MNPSRVQHEDAAPAIFIYNDRIVLYNRYGYLTEQIGVSGHDKDTGGGGLGIVLTVLAAMTYGVCIMATERVSRDADPLVIGVI